MGKQYSHLSVEERAVIMIQARCGASVRSIARTLRRSASSISREILRSRAGADAQEGYDATAAGQASRSSSYPRARTCRP